MASKTVLFSVLVSLLLASSVLSAASTSVGSADANSASDSDAAPERLESARVVASAPSEIGSALGSGCTLLKSIFSNYQRKAVLMDCPASARANLNMREDPIVRAVDLGANKLIGADRVQYEGNTGTGTRVAVIDSGIDYHHPELSSSYLGGWDFVDNDPDPMDEFGHGTAIAGIITADGLLPQEEASGAPNNQYGMARGVAPGAGVYSLRVLNSFGWGGTYNTVAAIYWAVDGQDGIYGTGDDPKTDVVSISLGSAGFTSFCDDYVIPELLEAVKYAESRNIPIVAAAGNYGPLSMISPACISNVIAVGAVDKNTDELASFSSQGYALDITAPGTDIYTTTLGGGYGIGTGTSDSAPMVSGTIALMRNAHPEYGVSQIKEALRNSAADKSPPSMGAQAGRLYGPQYGWGRLNSYDAVKNPALGSFHSTCRGDTCVLVKGAGTNECQTSAECFCRDSDGGKDAYAPGFTEGIYNGKWHAKRDDCESEREVGEYYCNGKYVQRAVIRCNEGDVCAEGVCQESVLYMPDMRIMNLNVPAKIIANTPTTISALTINTGTQAGKSHSGYTLNGNLVGKIEVPPLTPPLVYPISFSVTCTNIGTNIVAVGADIGSEIDESNETNNWENASFECAPPSATNQSGKNLTKTEKRLCPILPTEVDCTAAGAAAASKSAVWYDTYGCPYQCKKSYESPAVPAVDASKSKQPATATETNTGKKPESPAVPPTASETGEKGSESVTVPPKADTSDVSDVASAMVDIKTDTYAKIINTLGIYIEKYKKLSGAATVAI